MLVADALETRGDLAERLIPADALEGLGFPALRQRPLRDAGLAAHGMEQAIRRVHAIKIARHFAAQKTPCDRMCRISLHPGCAAGQCVHGYQNTA